MNILNKQLADIVDLSRKTQLHSQHIRTAKLCGCGKCLCCQYKKAYAGGDTNGTSKNTT